MVIPARSTVRSPISRIAADDGALVRAAQNVNAVLTTFVDAFEGSSSDAPTCRALQGESERRHLVAHLGALCWLQGVRIMDHLHDFTDALVRQRVLAAALAGRGVVETTAAIVYADETTSTLLQAGDRGQLLSELHRWYAGGRYDWFTADEHGERLDNYAAGKEPEIPADRKATNILTMLGKLERRAQAEWADMAPMGGVVRAVYAKLSDICHPATGTAILYSEPGVLQGWVRLKSSTDERSVRWFFRELGMFVAPIAKLAHTALLRLGETCARLEAEPDVTRTS